MAARKRKFCLNIAQINIRSLLTKFADLKDLVSQNNWDVILITETWLRDDIPDENLLINNYNFFRCDRADRGGGVAIYIKSLYKCSLSNKLNLNNSEQLWLSLNINNKHMCIGVVYRPPSSSVLEFLVSFEEILGNLTPKFDRLICGGDFNIDCLNESSSS